MKTRLTPLLTLFALTFLPAPTARAQKANTGSINGVVTDNSGGALDSVHVALASPALLGGQTSVTNTQGIYRFPTLPVGIYTVTYEVPGFTKLVREQINVSAGFAVELNVGLTLASVQQALTVTGETPLVDAQNSYTRNDFDHQTLTDLPTVRDVGSVQAISPGTRVSTPDVGGSQSGSIAGNTAYGYGAQVRTQIDGTNTTEGRSSVGMYFDFGSFQEVTIGVAANDASMPVPGQFVNLVLKGGGNQFHGSFYQDYETSSFQGTNITNKQLLQGAGTGARITEYHDTNGDLGGPILKDKLWFFASLRSQLAGRTVTGFPVENPNSNTDFTTTVKDVTYKLTGELSPKHRFSHFVQWDQKDMPLRGASNTYYESAVYETDLPAWAANIQYDGALTSRLFVTARVATWGYNSMNARKFEKGEVPSVRETELRNSNVAGTTAAFRYDRRRFQYEPTGSYFADHFLGANHQFKFGWLTEQEHRRVQQLSPLNNAALTFNSPAGSADFTTPYQVTLDNGPSDGTDYQMHHGAYIQDQIRIKRRLTLNVGVRWDYYRIHEDTEAVRNDATFAGFFYAGAPLANGYSIPATYPSYTFPGRQVLRYPFLPAPRLGVVFDLTGKGKTVVKVNWGRFYANPAPDFGNTVNYLQPTSYTFAWNDLNKDKQFQLNELGNYVSNTGGATVTVAPHIKSPAVNDASAFVEHQLSNDWSVRAGFVYRTLRHDWQQVDVARTANLYTNPVQAYDNGPDGVKGTADDRGAFTVYDIPTGVTVPVSRYQYQTPDNNNSHYQNYEATVSKRVSRKWSALGTFYYTFNDYLANGVPTNPNVAVNNSVHSHDWTAHISGTYSAPWGIQVSSILRGQSGTPLSRIVQVTGLRTGTVSIPVEPVGTYRSDDIWLADLRLQKQFKVGEHIKLDAFFDAFNLFNTSANQTQDNVTGVKTATVNGVSSTYQRFLATTGVIPPRVGRAGLRFTF
jgi:hypothetical protein